MCFMTPLRPLVARKGGWGSQLSVVLIQPEQFNYTAFTCCTAAAFSPSTLDQYKEKMFVTWSEKHEKITRVKLQKVRICLWSGGLQKKSLDTTCL